MVLLTLKLDFEMTGFQYDLMIVQKRLSFYWATL